MRYLMGVFMSHRCLNVTSYVDKQVKGEPMGKLIFALLALTLLLGVLIRIVYTTCFGLVVIEEGQYDSLKRRDDSKF